MDINFRKMSYHPVKFTYEQEQARLQRLLDDVTSNTEIFDDEESEGEEDNVEERVQFYR